MANTNNLLSILKADLKISVDAYDALLEEMISAAETAIETEGITIEYENGDTMLVEMYAAYLYRKRSENSGMPRHLRWMLNNRLMKEKAGGE